MEAGGLVATPRGDFPVVTVDLDLSARERWVKPGRKIKRMVHDLTDSYLAEIRDYVPKKLHFLLTKKPTLLTTMAHFPASLRFGELYKEAEGLSEATGVPAPLLALANCAYDFSQFSEDTVPEACTSAVYEGKSGCPVMIRYMDWFTPRGIGRYTIQVNFERSGVPAYSALGFAGFLGVVTAVSSEWALSFNQAPAEKVKKTIFTGCPATYAARLVCDKATTFKELEKGLMEAKPCTPFLSLICGRRPGEMRRLERPEADRGTKVSVGENRRLGLANHYLHRQHTKWNGPTEWVDDKGVTWCFDTEDRLACVEALAEGFQKKAALPSFTAMKVEPIFNENTVHLAVMSPGLGVARFGRRGAR